jgi:hypothetical protein
MEHVSWLVVGKILVSLTSRRGMMYGLAGFLWCKTKQAIKKNNISLNA